MSFYDDNYGYWETEDQSDIDMYYRFQETNVEKQCDGCRQWVCIQPQYGYCDSCANKRENGMEW